MKRIRCYVVRNEGIIGVFLAMLLVVVMVVPPFVAIGTNGLLSSPTRYCLVSSRSIRHQKQQLSNKYSIFPLAATRETEANERRKASLEQGNHPLISLNINLDAMAETGAASRAQELLQRIHALHEEGYYEVSPDIVSYNSVLKAWKENDSPEQAYDLLQRMLQMDADAVKVDVISFNTVILAFASRGDYPQAENLLRQMQSRDDYPDPDAVTYNAVLYSFAQSRDSCTTTLAENLLREMVSPDNDISADTISFNTVLSSWSQTVPKNPAAAQRAQELLELMDGLAGAGNSKVAPDVYSYTTVISAWGRSGNPEMAHKMFERMKRRGLSPNRYTYTVLINSLSREGKAEKAEQILYSMLAEYKAGNEHLKPDTVTFSAVIDAWAKLSSYTMPSAAENALRLLQMMHDMKDEGVGPNAITYTSVLTALAKSGAWDACDRAQKIVEDLYNDFENGTTDIRPSKIHYNTVLDAFARSPRAMKAVMASSYLNSMKEHKYPQCRPDTISYNSLIMASANSFGDRDLKKISFDIALNAFKTVVADGSDKRLRPQSTTFSHFCKAIRRLLANTPEQKSILRKTLLICCQRGFLDAKVISQVKQTCTTEEEWQEVAGAVAEYVSFQEKPQFYQMPKEWTCNTRL